MDNNNPESLISSIGKAEEELSESIENIGVENLQQTEAGKELLRIRRRDSLNEGADKLIYSAISTTSVAGVVDFTGGVGDVAVLVTAWGAMISAMAKIYEVSIDSENIQKMIIQGFSKVGLFKIGTRALISLLAVSGVGFVIGGGVNTLTNAMMTWRLGVILKEKFSQGQTFTPSEFDKMIKNVTSINISDVVEFRNWWFHNK